MKKGLSPGRNDAGPAVLKRHTGGPCFLDEIGNMPLEVQEKTLRLVEYGTFERVGSSESIEVDVRLVAATNVDLVKRTREGRFKADLLDRLSFEVVFLPPLRETGGRHSPLWPITSPPGMAFEMERHDTPVFAPETLRPFGALPLAGQHSGTQECGGAGRLSNR